MRDDLEKEAHKNPKLDWINTVDREEELLSLAKRCVEVLRGKQELRRG